MVIGFDRGPTEILRPFWLRPAVAALVIAAHALLVIAVLWPRDIGPPAETSIEINVAPQQFAAAAATPSTSGAMPELVPSEAMPVDAAAPTMPPATPEATPSEAPAEVIASAPESVLLAPPPAAEILPPPAVAAEIPSQPTPPMAQADDAAIPIPASPTTPAIDETQDDVARVVPTEQRHQALIDQKKTAEREADHREAAERAKQAAGLAQRQARARGSAARATVARPASLPPVQAPAAASAPSAVSAVAIGAYRGQVIGHLSAYKHYPESARARGAEGRPSVAFVLDASGRVVSVTLTHASGQSDIDAEVVAMVHRASPFPPPPAGAGRSFSATIGFVLH
jgi:protein TonB